MSDFSLILVLQIKTSVNRNKTVDEVIHIAVIPLAIQNHILKIEFSRF